VEKNEMSCIAIARFGFARLQQLRRAREHKQRGPTSVGDNGECDVGECVRQQTDGLEFGG
jgi:hypothetical protein